MLDLPSLGIERSGNIMDFEKFTEGPLPITKPTRQPIPEDWNEQASFSGFFHFSFESSLKEIRLTVYLFP